jgi:uncharacterized protein YukE
MSRQLVILGTSVTLPDPASVTDLAASFQQQGGQLAHLQTTLQSLTKPGAWGDWTGLAADAFGQSIGQLPAELGDAGDAYDDVASALQQYASQLEPLVNSLSSLSYSAEDAEGTLAAVSTARSQVMASGQDPATTGWDAQLADAAAAVTAVQGQLNRLLGELNELAVTCTRQIKAAEPKTAGKSLFGSLESDFVRDVAEPLAHAAKEAFRLDEDLVKLDLEADELGLFGAAAVIEALYIHPITDLLHDATKDLDAAKLAHILGDVAGVLGIVALLPIPGFDVVAGLLSLGLGGAAAGVEWYAAAHHEQGASYLQAGVDTLTLALSGVGLVAKAGVAAEGLADGADAADSGQNLWVTGLQRAFSPSDIKASISEEHMPSGGLGGFGQKLFNNVSEQMVGTFPSGGADSSPAAVTVARVGWTAERLDNLVTTAQDVADHKTESQVL